MVLVAFRISKLRELFNKLFSKFRSKRFWVARGQNSGGVVGGVGSKRAATVVGWLSE